MERRLFLKIGTGAAVSGALAACGGGGGGSPGTGGTTIPPITTPPSEPAQRNVVLLWNKVAISAIRATRPAPPIAARSLAIVHTVIYDAWAAYDPVALGTRLGAQLRRPMAEQTAANRTEAISFAAFIALRDQFPSQNAVFEAQMAALGYNPADAIAGYTSPAGIGTIAAHTFIQFAYGDGANQLGRLTASGLAYADYTAYAARNQPMIVAEATPRTAIANPSAWQPLTYTDAGGVLRTQSFVVPFWGRVRPFALSSGSQFRPSAPSVLGSQAFLDQAQHMINVQAGLTETHKSIVDFWAGGVAGDLPTALWSQFAHVVSARDNNTEAADVKLFFAMSNSLFDAGIAAWDAKRAYDSARPITAIRYLFNGQTIQGYGPQGPAGGLQAIRGETWTPFQLKTAPVPGHPDYVSGHSTYSAAAAEVLRLFTGSDAFNHSVTIAPRSLLVDPALPTAAITLAWDTFSFAACEAGNSRVLGGIHFENADLTGRALGVRVGATVFQRAQNLWLGKTS
ncbi:MAG: phosphoesterase [Pseudomonadota bacterium]